MRFVRTALITGIASAALAGAALAADAPAKVMLVALPDGSVEHVRLADDAAPHLVLIHTPAPADIFETAFGPSSPFAEMDRLAAAMEAHAASMMRQAATMAAETPFSDGKGIVMANAQGQPVGVMHYSYVSSTTSADGCTRTVQYSSDGAAPDDRPRMIQTSSGSCGTDRPAPAISPTGPKAAPAPRITPVSVPGPLQAFTPSRT